MTLLVVIYMINVMALIRISFSSAQYHQPITYRNIISYTVNIFHCVIIVRLTSLMNKMSQINNWFFIHKIQLMSCTVCFCLLNVLAGAEKRRKKIRYNN